MLFVIHNLLCHLIPNGVWAPPNRFWGTSCPDQAHIVQNSEVNRCPVIPGANQWLFAIFQEHKRKNFTLVGLFSRGFRGPQLRRWYSMEPELKTRESLYRYWYWYFYICIIIGTFILTLFLILLYWHCYCYCDIFLTSSFCWVNFDNVTLLYFICLKFLNVFVFHYIPSEYNIFDIFLTSFFCWANFDMITLLFFSRFISNWVFYISTLSL